MAAALASEGGLPDTCPRGRPRPPSAPRSGRRARSASAPASPPTPAPWETASLPPILGDPSSTVTPTPSARRKNAAAKPAIPPPTTTTLGCPPSICPPWQIPPTLVHAGGPQDLGSLAALAE